MTHSMPYRDRPAWFIELIKLSGCTIKFYGMCAVGGSVEPDLIGVAKQNLSETERFGPEDKYGFCLLHRGEEAIWLLLDWWEQDILHQRLFWSELGNVEFQEGPPKNEMACVWELQVISHERDAWVRNVLQDPAQPNFEAYLQDRIRIE